jgi:hypothetical protein
MSQVGRSRRYSEVSVSRPRKHGDRYPSGKLKPQEQIAPAAWGRIKSETIKLVLDPKMQSEIARLSLIGELTNSQAVTAFRVADIYQQYHRYKKLRTSAKSASYEIGFGSSDIDEERMSDDQIEAYEAAILKAEGDWKALDEGLRRFRGEVRAAVYSLCVENQPINPTLYEDVRVVLNAIAVRWSPDGRKRQRLTATATLKRAVAPIDQLQAETPRREDPGMKAVRAIAHKLLPHLDQQGVDKVAEVWAALRDRERLRQSRR